MHNAEPLAGLVVFMAVPLCAFAILGKRLGRLARETGAITVPDLFRERFRSPALGAVSSIIMIFVLTFSLIAQFKGGAIILQMVLPELPGMTHTGHSLG